MSKAYSYELSIKSPTSDEVINTCFLRPLANIVVRLVFHTSITPNQITLISLILGICAAVFYNVDFKYSLMIAALLVFLKNILDGVDGQLARARAQVTRTGRFLDSIIDFVVNWAIYFSIGILLFKTHQNIIYIFLSILALFSMTLRSSYYVFYSTQFLHLNGLYKNNRVCEDFQKEDLNNKKMIIILQEMFLFIYGWQDKLITKLDKWCRGGNSISDSIWYSNKTALRINGFIGAGTELTLLAVFTALSMLEVYIYLNLFLMNGIMLASIIYRKTILKQSGFSHGF